MVVANKQTSQYIQVQKTLAELSLSKLVKTTEKIDFLIMRTYTKISKYN